VPPSDLRISSTSDSIVVSAAVSPLPAVLSESEQQIVLTLLEGRSNAEIAEARGTSVKTVANQLQAVYRKLGVGSRDELALLLIGAEPDE
jgi:DNA-binding CsgD family transcriptional regulator